MKFVFSILLLTLFALPDSLAAHNEDSLDNYLRQLLSTQAIPGFSVVLVKNGRIVFTKGYGKETAGNTKPFTPRTLSAIGSLTKSITALAVLHLAEEGRLSLDTPLVRYIPWFRTLNKERSDKITARMLLNNTSGLVMHNTLPVTDDQNKAQEMLIRNMATFFLTREPGASYEYSNAGFCAAGVLITAVTGMPYSTFIDDSILRPLGMRRSSTDPRVLKNMPVISGHYFGLHRMYPGDPHIAEESNAWLPAGASLFSCAEDMGKYLVFLQNRSSAVLSSRGFDQLWKTAIRFPGLSKEDGGDGSRFGYGMGWMIANVEGRTLYLHAGSTGKMSACMVMDAAAGISAAFLANIDLTFIDKYHYSTMLTIANNILRIARGLSPSVYGVPRIDDPFRNTFELPAHIRERYTGTYTLGSGDVYYLFRGSHLEITSGAEGMKAMLVRNGQVLQEYLLDFISQVSGVTRNIAIPQHFRFRVGPDGNLEGLQVGDIPFIKSDAQDNPNYRRAVSSAGTISFLVPVHYSTKILNGGITATSADGNAEYSGTISAGGEISLPALFKQISGRNNSFYSGKLQEETIGENTWQEQCFVITVAGRKRSILIMRSRIQGKLCVLALACDAEKITIQLQSHFRRLINSLQIL